MDAKQQFIEEYAPVAENVGQKIGVSPDILLSQWGLETNWGRSVIGHHNLGNIKDFAGGGKKAEGESYLNFEDPEAFGDYYAHMIKRNFPDAVGVGSDVEKFSEGLQSGKKGGYAEDPNYAESLANTVETTRSIYEPPKEEEKPLSDRAIETVDKMADDERLQDVAAVAGLGAAKGAAEKFFINPEAPVQISEKDIFRAQQKVAEAQERLNSLKEIAASKNLNPQELEQIRIKANDELLNATSELREARTAQRASMREPIPTVESIAERMAKAEAADAAARAEKLTGAQNYAKSMYGRTGAPEPLPQSLIDKIESMSGKTERGATTLMREEEARRAAGRRINPNIRLFDSQGIALPEEIGRELMAAQQMEAEAARQSSILERNTAAFAERQAEAQRVLQAQQEAAAKVEAAREQRQLAQIADQDARRQASEARKLTSQLETRQQNVDEATAIAERLSKERPGGLQRFLTGAGLRAAKSPILMGGLGGAGAALSFNDAMERYKNGDRTGAVLSALEAGLSAMSMAPPVGIGVPIKGLGTAGALGLLPLIMYRDYLKSRPEAPQEISSTR